MELHEIEKNLVEIENKLSDIDSLTEEEIKELRKEHYYYYRHRQLYQKEFEAFREKFYSEFYDEYEKVAKKFDIPLDLVICASLNNFVGFVESDLIDMIGDEFKHRLHEKV